MPKVGGSGSLMRASQATNISTAVLSRILLIPSAYRHVSLPQVRGLPVQQAVPDQRGVVLHRPRL